jgi:hypothetical protein
MFKEFRKHYPQGSLVTELVQVDREKYIVRALIQVDGVTLLTSLAAASSVEEAEDRARERVLALSDLDLGTRNAPLTGTFGSFPDSRSIEKEKTVVNSNNNDKNRTTAASLSAGEETPKTLVSSHKIPPEAIDRSLATTEAKTNGKQIDLFDVPPIVKPIQQPSEKILPEVQTNTSVVSTVEPQTLESIDPMDLIAKTDIELERLRWTKEQGRDFLLQHYGKRSRHVLNERELLDFLNHLRSQ